MSVARRFPAASLVMALALLGAGCDNSPFIDTFLLPLGYFPCASIDSVTGTWQSAPPRPLPDTPPDLDAGTLPDAGSASCPDAGAAVVPDASPPGCEWFVFNQNTTYVIEHPLGRIPSLIVVYISFYPDGRGSSIATGDTFLVQASCATSITIRNDTNQRFYARVVLL